MALSFHTTSVAIFVGSADPDERLAAHKTGRAALRLAVAVEQLFRSLDLVGLRPVVCEHGDHVVRPLLPEPVVARESEGDAELSVQSCRQLDVKYRASQLPTGNALGRQLRRPAYRLAWKST